MFYHLANTDFVLDIYFVVIQVDSNSNFALLHSRYKIPNLISILTLAENYKITKISQFQCHCFMIFLSDFIVIFTTIANAPL